MPYKILMIDDDVDQLLVFQPILQKAGYIVELAHDSTEGMEKFMAMKPDVVFVDLAMEHFDSGFVLCHKIKALPLGQKTPVIIMTAAGHETGIRFSTQTSEERKWIHADDYLDKPIPARDLLQYLKEKIFKESQEIREKK